MGIFRRKYSKKITRHFDESKKKKLITVYRFFCIIFIIHGIWFMFVLLLLLKSNTEIERAYNNSNETFFLPFRNYNLNRILRIYRIICFCCCFFVVVVVAYFVCIAFCMRINRNDVIGTMQVLLSVVSI